ncbi:sodium-coupled neutral amino acid transporter 4 [Lates japonicus]|uniref:Sodium-coupled neutral amino acid transporter 4 n=1 Tax=Lates japonicus TaxID=270547 RepID=A0AAD3NKY1_LATJO|nr:sodium-coupled neutral amino acid transporter 4 [Lates japonicus]
MTAQTGLPRDVRRTLTQLPSRIDNQPHFVLDHVARSINNPTNGHHEYQPRSTAYTVPILAFAFVCHPEVLPIYSELKDRSRKKMQNVSNLSILAMLIMYMLSALFGYLTFYDNVEAELLHTFTKVYKFDTMLLLVRLAVLTAVTLTVPIVLFPSSQHY